MLSYHLLGVLELFGRKELDSVQRELKTKRMHLLSQDQKVLQYEAQLYESQRQLEKQKDVSIKLGLKIEELKMKYEPDKMLGRMDY